MRAGMIGSTCSPALPVTGKLHPFAGAPPRLAIDNARRLNMVTRISTGQRFLAKIIIMMVIEVAAVVTRSAGAEERVLTKTIRLQKCIEPALACNPDLKIEHLNPQIEQWSIARERSAFEPVIGGNYARDNEPLDPEE